MGLEHKIAIISQNSKESIISSNMNSVTVSDVIIQYIGDSLKWLHTIWNGKKIQEGICYYGFSIIEGDELVKFKNILKQWKALFSLAPKEFYLTGNFLTDKEQYEKNLMERDEILKVLELCINICEEAINEGGKILYNGI